MKNSPFRSLRSLNLPLFLSYACVAFIRSALLVLSGILFVSFSLRAAPTPAAFTLGLEGDQLTVKNAEGQLIAQLPKATIGKTIEVPPVAFNVSFGKNAQGRLSAIISPNPEHLSPLSFGVLDRSIEMDQESVVTLTFSQNGSMVDIDPGFVGVVMVSNPKASSLSTAAVSSPNAPAIVGAPVNVETPVSLLADVQSSKKETDILAFNPDKPPTKKEIATAQAAHQVYKKEVFWVEPVTPPNASKSMAIGPNEIKLAEVKGDVKVVTADGKTVAGQNGLLINSGTSVMTGPASSTAVLIGGVNSVRFVAQSNGSVTSSLENGKRTTVINLTSGMVFNKVGKREGEIQDYRVTSPSGTATAKGTDFSAKINIDGKAFTVVCAQGAVELMDEAGKVIGNAVPGENHSLALVSTQTFGTAEKTKEIMETLAIASEISEKINGLLDRQSKGQTLSAAELAYLANIPSINVAVQPTESNSVFLNSRQMPNPIQLVSLFDSMVNVSNQIGLTMPELFSGQSFVLGGGNLTAGSLPETSINTALSENSRGDLAPLAIDKLPPVLVTGNPSPNGTETTLTSNDPNFDNSKVPDPTDPVRRPATGTILLPGVVDKDNNVKSVAVANTAGLTTPF